MKKIPTRLIALCLALCTLLAATAFAADQSYDYPDDWSRNALVFAVENGILGGDQHHRLNPSNNITRAEMAAVLVRMLGASGKADLSAFTDVDTTDWYFPELSAAVAAGIFSGTDRTKMQPDASLTREQAIVVMSRAFGIADTDRETYKKFADGDKISGYARDAVSAMAKQGFLSGYSDGSVRPQAYITRAEIAQLLYNLFDCIADTPDQIPSSGRVLYRGSQALPDSLHLDGSLVIGQSYLGPLSPSDWQISGFLSVRCGSEVTADLTALQAQQLVFAPTSGKLTAQNDTVFLGGSVDFTGACKTLTLLSGNHTYIGSCEELILREGAYLVMNGDVAGAITAETLSALVLHGSAASLVTGNQVGLTVSGSIPTVILGKECKLHIYGKVDSISIGKRSEVILEKDIDSIDLSADYVHLTLNGRVGSVRATGRDDIIDGSGSVGELSYYSSTVFTIACDSTVDLWEQEFGEDYANALSTVQTMKIPCIVQRDTSLYETNGGIGYITTIPKGTLVYNENWPDGAFMRVTTPSGQRGWINRYHVYIDVDNATYDGTLDYSEGTKSGFVNLRGYSSQTDYLIWISRYTQKVIIYTGYKGNWTVYKTCPCATGSVYTPTPEGIYDIYEKTWSWDFHGYIVTNVSLFYGGMAFHTYLLNYNGTDYNSSLGWPMSHGCVRMKPEDAAFIYNSIPRHTTVIVY